MALAASVTLCTTTTALALTDEQALSEGMTPIEEYVLNEMKSIVTPGLNKAGVLEAANRHRLVIAVNKAAQGPQAQTLTIYENGVETFKTKISTGREKQEKAKSGRIYLSTTPKGYFRPTKIYKDYLSYTWNAPMPNAVFIIGGIALHATSESHYKELGTRASGGCVRLKLPESKMIREKVMDTGRGSQIGQYNVVSEASGRNRVTNNSVLVDQIDRNTGDILNSKLLSWDTVVVVYEE